MQSLSGRHPAGAPYFHYQLRYVKAILPHGGIVTYPGYARVNRETERRPTIQDEIKGKGRALTTIASPEGALKSARDFLSRGAEG